MRNTVDQGGSCDGEGRGDVADRKGYVPDASPNPRGGYPNESDTDCHMSRARYAGQSAPWSWEVADDREWIQQAKLIGR